MLLSRVFFSIVILFQIFPAARIIAGDNPISVRAVRVTVPPLVDGLLDDTCWKSAAPATGFIQRDPEEGKEASERTEIRVLYDDEALYFGCMMYDSDPTGIVSPLTRRDRDIETDWTSIMIDAFNDNQTCMEFVFNPAGVKADMLQYDDGDREDNSWDPVWMLETKRLPDGWSAEIRIPFHVLRYRSDVSEEKSAVVWGINFLRYISRKKETDRWAFTPKSQSGFISRFGQLTGLTSLPDPRLLEILPFATSRHSDDPATSVSDRKQQFLGNAGLDVKYGLSSNFTVDATVNPDFGQVEADPAVLNLSTYETFYPENRPFFIEGTQILHFTTFGGDFGPGMFYSRRIGRGLSMDEVNVPPGGRIDDIPQQTTILGAAKLTGKTSSGLSLGVLQAFTQEENAEVLDPAGIRSEQTIEPAAHYNVIRIKQDVLQNSSIGMIVTSVAKHSRVPAFTNGYDWNLRLARNTYQLSGFLALSRTTGRDGERLSGSAGKIGFQRIAAEHWLWSLSCDYTSRRYNINDVGFFFSPDDAGAIGSIHYKEDVPGRILRNYSMNLSYHQRHNFDGANLIRQIQLTGSTLFTNYWSFSSSFDTDHGLYDERETRGRGLYRRPAVSAVSFAVASDMGKSLVVELSPGFSWDSKEKQEVGIGFEMEIKPLTWMDWELSSNIRSIDKQEAWVTNDSTGSVFADRTTRDYSFTVRSTITFTRDLTLQLYQQIFLAKGHFDNFRLLQGTSDFLPAAGLYSPDFNEQVLHTNVVLRWEYLPGSTMFLVWSQARNGGSGDYYTSFGSDFSDSFRIPASNVLLLKVSYWMSI